MNDQIKPDPVEAFQALAKSIGEANKKVQELLASRRKVIIKGPDIKPDVYGGYLQKKKRRHKK